MQRIWFHESYCKYIVWKTHINSPKEKTNEIDSCICVGENMLNKINYTIYVYKHFNVTKYLVVSWMLGENVLKLSALTSKCFINANLGSVLFTLPASLLIRCLSVKARKRNHYRPSYINNMQSDLVL